MDVLTAFSGEEAITPGRWTRPGDYYFGDFITNGNLTTQSLTAGYWWANPVYIRTRRSVRNLAVSCSTASATTLVRAMLYANASTGGYDPVGATLVMDSGPISLTATGIRNGVDNNVILPPGLYWSVLQVGGTGGVLHRVPFGATMGTWLYAVGNIMNGFASAGGSADTNQSPPAMMDNRLNGYTNGNNLVLLRMA